EERVVKEALMMTADCADDHVLVLANEQWHVGVIGIAASRVMQERYRPTVIIGADGKGSCRSIAGFSIVEALAGCADILKRFGGHEMAAGLNIAAGKIGELRRRLNEHARRVLKSEDLQRAVRVDAVVRLEELDADLFEALGKLEPCGQDNPAPTFAVLGVRLRGPARVVG